MIARLETVSREPALLNMTAAAKLVTAAALAREESRGGHWRSDYPQTEKTGSAHLHDLGRCGHASPRRVREILPRRASSMTIVLMT